MRPIRLRVENFLGIEELDYAFQPGVYVIVGRNGSGKSSFFEAVYFALFGKAIRVGDRKSVVRRGERYAKIIFDFERGDKIYRVVRKISARGAQEAVLMLVDNGSLKMLKNRVRDVDEEIVELLAIDGETFKKVFLIPQGEITAVMDDARNFRKLFMRISGMEEMISKLRDGLAIIKEEMNFGELRGRFERLREELALMKTEKEMKEKIKVLRGKIGELEERKRELLRTKFELERCVSREEDLKKMRKLQKMLEELEDIVEKEKIARELSDVFESLKKLEDLRDTISEIKKDMDIKMEEKENLEEVLEKSKKDYEKLKRRIENLDEEIHEGEKSLEKLRGIVTKASPILAELERSLVKLEDGLRYLDGIEKELERLTREEEESSSRLEKLESLKRKLEQEISGLRAMEMEYMAAKIALSLNVGEKCPVCGGTFRGREKASVKFDESRLKDLEERIRNLERELAAEERNLALLKTRKRDLEMNLEEMKVEIEELNEKIGNLRVRLKEIGFEGDVDERVRLLEDELKSKRQERVLLEKKISDLLTEIHEYESRLVGIGVELSRMSEEVERASAEQEELEGFILEKLSTFDMTLEEAVEYEKYLDGNAEREYERLKGILEALVEELGEVDEKVVEGCKLRMVEIEEELKRTDRELSEALETVGELEGALERRRELERELHELEPRVAETERDARLINEITARLRIDKIWPYVFEKLGKPVVEIASDRIQALTDGKFRLSLRGESVIVVDSSGLERGVSLLSGGEKTLVSLVLALTISEYVGGGISLFFIDEGFAALDEVNRERVAEMVGRLEEHGKTVMFITHFEDLADKFENVVKMENGRIVG